MQNRIADIPLLIFVKAVHQEDTVVDAQRDQHDEPEERCRPAYARVTEDVDEDPFRKSDRSVERQHQRQDNVYRHDQRTKQQHQDNEDPGQHQDHRACIVIARNGFEVIKCTGYAADRNFGVFQLCPFDCGLYGGFYLTDPVDGFPAVRIAGEDHFQFHDFAVFGQVRIKHLSDLFVLKRLLRNVPAIQPIICAAYLRQVILCGV
ncbi:hypothetical protein D3C81_1501650 [compost metagenome]